MCGKFVEMVDLRLDARFTQDPPQVTVYPRGIVACGNAAKTICAVYDMLQAKWSDLNMIFNLHKAAAIYAPVGLLHLFFYVKSNPTDCKLIHAVTDILDPDVGKHKILDVSTVEDCNGIVHSIKAAATLSSGEHQSVKIYVANEYYMRCFKENDSVTYRGEKIDLDFHFKSGCMVAAEDSLYFIQARETLMCKRFNPRDKTFTEKRGPKLRSDSTSTAVYFEGQIYLFNGSPKQERTYLQIYDIEKDKWEVSELKMPCGLTGTTAVLMNSFPRSEAELNILRQHLTP